MARVKRGTGARRRRNKILKEARGFVGGRSKIYRRAVEAVQRSWVYAYRDRKVRKRDFRRLWITRINAAAHQHGMCYSTFMYGLKQAGVELDRKMLSEMAARDPDGFAHIAEVAKGHAAKAE